MGTSLDLDTAYGLLVKATEELGILSNHSMSDSGKTAYINLNVKPASVVSVSKTPHIGHTHGKSICYNLNLSDGAKTEYSEKRCRTIYQYNTADMEKLLQTLKIIASKRG